MEYWTIALQILTVLVFGYYYLSKRYNYWADRGIKGPPPTFGFGNMWDFLRHGQVKMELDWYAKYGRVYGWFQGFTPRYTIADPELIKQVLVKDFTVFVNRDVNRFKHEIWTHNLFNTEDEQWRRIRAITSPSFTTGKLKGMHSMMNKAVEQLAEFFRQSIERNSGEMNIKEVVTGFTIDVIASTSFATATNSNDFSKDRSQNTFLQNGLQLFDFKFWKLIAFFALPNKLSKLIGAELGFNMGPFHFFVDLSKAILEQRRKEGGKVKRNDLVQLMMDAFVYEDELLEKNYDKLTATADNDETEEVDAKIQQNGSAIRRQLTENEIIAQSILFFVAGFETTGTTLSNALYNLAIHPEIQERLAAELNSALDGLEVDSPEYFDKVNYHIPYLEAIIKETLRLCPPVTRLQRRVGEHGYKLNGVPLEKDTHLDVAVYAVHHSEDFYPEPERFNPDRFMPENKHNMVPYTYLPFGHGPRNCIGMRFAYQEIRLCLAKIIRDFRFSRAKDTKVPLEFNKFGVLSSKNIPLKVSKR